MTTPTIPALRALLAAAAEQSGSSRWNCGVEREDGTAQVYSPSRGPLRVVVPVAETSKVCGDAIVAAVNALPGLLDRLEAAEAKVAWFEGVGLDIAHGRMREVLQVKRSPDGSWPSTVSETERVVRERDEAVAVLRECEWKYNERAGCNVCPVCDGDEPKHFEGCNVALVLASAGGSSTPDTSTKTRPR